MRKTFILQWNSIDDDDNSNNWDDGDNDNNGEDNNDNNNNCYCYHYVIIVIIIINNNVDGKLFCVQYQIKLQQIDPRLSQNHSSHLVDTYVTESHLCMWSVITHVNYLQALCNILTPCSLLADVFRNICGFFFFLRKSIFLYMSTINFHLLIVTTGK